MGSRNAYKPSNSSFVPMVRNSSRCAASPGRAALSTTRGWLCRKHALIRARRSSAISRSVLTSRVSRRRGNTTASAIPTEREVEQPLPQGGAVGIDLGVVRCAPLNSFKRHATALCKAQQALCRKQKFSNNWKKANGRIQRIHARIGNARRDYRHKNSTAISQNHAMVCIEDLQGAEHVQVGGRLNPSAGQTRSSQVWPEQIHPRSGLVRVPPPIGVQAVVEWW
jgi:hypothetical protein